MAPLNFSRTLGLSQYLHMSVTLSTECPPSTLPKVASRVIRPTFSAQQQTGMTPSSCKCNTPRML